MPYGSYTDIILSLELQLIDIAAAAGTKFRMTLALPVGAVMNCADNSGAKSESSQRIRYVSVRRDAKG